jgi:hypothetical protein
MDIQGAIVSRQTNEKGKKSWAKAGLRVRDGEGDNHLGASMAYISLPAAFAMADNVDSHH